jgi:DegV family protein with EDD domain
MTVGIVTDSTCDLPLEIIEHYGIEILPLSITMGDETFIDGVDITKEEFYQKLPLYDPAPTTAAPGPDIFNRQYEALAESGVESILSIHISEALSATINSARLAVESFKKIPVTVIDSGQLSMGLGFLVEIAAKLAKAGHQAEEIISALSEKMPRTYTFAALDTLEYLRRSGRMHLAVARFGEILRLKPLLHMNQGNPVAHRTRTTRKAMDRLFHWLNEYGPHEKLAVVHAGVIDRAEELRNQVRHLFPDLEIPIMQITPVLGAHLGVGAIGFSCISKNGS